MGLSSIGATVNSLVQLGISEATAAEIRQFLDNCATDLADGTPDNVGHNAFGHAPASLQLASDATKARTHVADALKDMAAGLQGYGDVVTALYSQANEIDLATKQDLDKQTAAANACQPPSFAAPSTCTLPGSSAEDD
jgi:hypothetical protein